MDVTGEKRVCAKRTLLYKAGRSLDPLANVTITEEMWNKRPGRLIVVHGVPFELEVVISTSGREKVELLVKCDRLEVVRLVERREGPGKSTCLKLVWRRDIMLAHGACGVSVSKQNHAKAPRILCYLVYFGLQCKKSTTPKTLHHSPEDLREGGPVRLIL